MNNNRNEAGKEFDPSEKEIAEIIGGMSEDKKNYLMFVLRQIELGTDFAKWFKASMTMDGKEWIVFNKKVNAAIAILRMIKIIRDHPNYAVSDQGKVYRITRDGYKELKPIIFGKKYLGVRLDGKDELIHKLVMDAFSPAKDDGRDCISHIDKDLTNNNLNNLIRVNKSELNYMAPILPSIRIKKMRDFIEK